MADNEQTRVLRDMTDITKLINRIQIFYLARIAVQVQNEQQINTDEIHHLAYLKQQLIDIVAHIGC